MTKKKHFVSQITVCSGFQRDTPHRELLFHYDLSVVRPVQTKLLHHTWMLSSCFTTQEFNEIMETIPIQGNVRVIFNLMATCVVCCQLPQTNTGTFMSLRFFFHIFFTEFNFFYFCYITLFPCLHNFWFY